MENGECPYQLKCKFAHGLHELTKDRYVNLKYKILKIFDDKAEF